MLVYANRLHLNRPANLDHYFAAVARWASRRPKVTLSAKQVRGPSTRRFDDPLGTKFESWIAEDPSEILHAARLSHGDREASGRLWRTEVGLSAPAESATIICTILLETQEISTRVQRDIELRPPRLVADLIEVCGLAASAPGGTERELTERNAGDVYNYELLDSQRSHAAIIISPTASGDYLVNLGRLRELVVGLADVWRIPAIADTWAMGRLFTNAPSPYGGAIAIVFPRRISDTRDYVPSRVFTAAEIQNLPSGTVESHLLESLTHRFNLPFSWRHISPDRVRDKLRARTLGQLRDAVAAVPAAAEFEALFNKVAEDDAELRAQLDAMTAERDRYWEQYEDAEDRIRKLRFDQEQLEAQLAEAKLARKGGKGISADLRSAVVSSVLRPPTVESALALVEQLFPERVLVLSDARKSARDHDRFAFGSDVFALLIKLVDEYWQRLASGTPDSEARKVFGQYEFAAKEANLSKVGLRARTFDVPGRGQLFLEAHLKIQRGPNPAESWRCHFEWLPDAKRLVIGHCGKHLPG